MLKKYCLVPIMLLILTVPQRLQALDIYTLECIADAPMYGYSSEANLNYGGRPHMRIKDYQGIPFLQFDFEGLEGTEAVSCTLFVSSIDGQFAFCTDIISTIAVPWYEGTKDGEIEPGTSCFTHRFYPDSLWFGPGSDARSVVNGTNGSLINSQNICFPEGGGWAEVEIDVELAQQLINGEVYGLALWGNQWANRDIYSREVENGASFLEIEVEQGEVVPPSPVTDLAASVEDYHGRFTLNWTAPGDDGTEGTAALYEFRYSANTIADNSAWEAAEALPGAPKPDSAGILQSWTVETLTPGGTYHIAMQARDEAWNWSGLSNDVTVTVPLDNTPPAGISDLEGMPGTGNGEVILSWTAPGDDGNGGTASRYELRYSSAPVDESNWEQADSFPVLADPEEAGTAESYVVTGLTPGETYYFALRAWDEVPQAGPVSNSASATASSADYNLWAVPPYYKINPRTGNAFEYDEASYDTPGAPAPYKAFNRVWDASESKVRLLAGRNEFVGFQAVIEKVIPQDTLRNIEVSLSRLRGPMSLDMKFTRLYREWYFKFDDVMYPDLLVPFETDGGDYQVNPFTIPDSLQQAWIFKGVEQNNQTVFVDIYIPHNAAQGIYSATLTVSGQGVSTRQIAVEVEVLNFQLSDETHYAVDLNCYRDVSNPGWRVYGPSNPELSDSLERVVQRMLHEHRAYLDIVPYGQSPSGTASFRHAPDLSGSGENLTVSDWAEYDKRFDPLFSGSAFINNPRSGVPVPFYYLPFHTTWPVPRQDKNIDDWVFEDQDYIAGWTNIVTEFEAHINQMGWTRTNFICYQNEKENYGNAWDLDEPTTQEHYTALNFYAGMFHNGLKGDGAASMIYRCDMGHYSYLKGELDDAVDIWVLNRGDYPEPKIRERQAAGAMAWSYGSAPQIYKHMELNYVDYFTNWARGARGYCYWDTFGAWDDTGNAWMRNHPGDTNLFYPGYAGVKNMIGHVACPTLRMKTIRDIAEIMEALHVMGSSSSYTVEQSETFARQYNTGELESYVQAEEDLKRLIDGISGTAPEPPPVGEKSCDFSNDGNITISDVIAFLLLAREDPNDPDLDWNEDGGYTIADAISLLIDIMKGNCPDAAVLLAGATDPLAVTGIAGLRENDLEYLETMLKQMNLSPEQEAAFKLVLYGRNTAAELPQSFSLQQNTPNPFNPSTTITYTVPEGSTTPVKLEVYNLRGARVRLLVDEERSPGTYHVFWDGADDTGAAVGSGIYFYRMRAGDFVQTRKMVLLK